MKTFKELYESSATVEQRKKQARRMSKKAKNPVIQIKKQRAMLKPRNPAKLAQIARKKTIQSFRDKFYPSYNDMSIQQKVKVDQMIMQKYGKKIDAISKKAAKVLQKQEVERVKKAKEAQKDA